MGRIGSEGGEMSTPSDARPERIDVNDQAACESWAHRLNVTHEKLREAVAAAGDDPLKVERRLRELERKRQEDSGGRGFA
jgi:hypothetical protein